VPASQRRLRRLLAGMSWGGAGPSGGPVGGPRAGRALAEEAVWEEFEERPWAGRNAAEEVEQIVDCWSCASSQGCLAEIRVYGWERLLIKGTSLFDLRALCRMRPVARAHLIMREVRRADKELKAAYAIWFREEQCSHWSQVRTRIIPLPDCVDCGIATGCWCDFCGRPLCSVCDRVHTAWHARRAA
jgi:hypothetical protein